MAATKERGQRDTAARAERLPPEMAFLAAIVRQVLSDVRSPDDHVRQEALGFLRNTKHVAYWDHFLGLSGRLEREAAALVGGV